jgi:hypothetical protein
MCVLSQPAAPALTDEQILDLVLNQAPGSIAHLDRGANLLLANCGRGDCLLALARRFPRSRLYGVESSAHERGAARQAVHASMRQNVWIQPDTVHLPDLTGTFHLALRLSQAAGVELTEIALLLKPGGLLFDLHLTAPLGSLYRAANLTVMRSVRLPDGFCTLALK